MIMPNTLNLQPASLGRKQRLGLAMSELRKRSASVNSSLGLALPQAPRHSLLHQSSQRPPASAPNLNHSMKPLSLISIEWLPLLDRPRRPGRLTRHFRFQYHVPSSSLLSTSSPLIWPPLSFARSRLQHPRPL